MRSDLDNVSKIKKALLVLKTQKKNTFMVYPGQTDDGAFSLLYIRDEGTVSRQKINNNGELFSLGNSTRNFNSLVELIEYYKNSSTTLKLEYPLTKELQQKQEQEQQQTPSLNGIILDRSGGKKLGFKLKTGDEGAVITEVDPDGQAAQHSRIKPGAVITHINGIEVREMKMGPIGGIIKSNDTITLQIKPE